MEIRAVRKSELEQVVELCCLAFNPDGHERYWQYVRGDSSYRLPQTRVVVCERHGYFDPARLGTADAGRCVPCNNGRHWRRLHTSEVSWGWVCICPHARNN